MEENHRKEIERERMEKEKYQKKLEEMETKLSKLTTPSFSSTLQVKLNNLKFSPIDFILYIYIYLYPRRE